MPSIPLPAVPPRPRRPAPRLDRRALNRALLARQLLLQRVGLSVPATLERLVGMQAQQPLPPYVGLWTRLAGFGPDDLARLLESRRVVRLALMRSTLHLVTARDCLALRPVLHPVLARGLAGGGGRVAGVDLAALAGYARALVDERPRTSGELGTLLAARFAGRDPAALAYAARGLLALVQVPPRGLWGKSGLPLCTTAESWLGQPLGQERSPVPLVRRYLAAFGPATVADMQAWSGLTRLAEVVAAMPALVRFADGDGRELYDLRGAPRPDADTPAPVRFLPEYDNALLAHDERSRIVDGGHRGLMMTPNGIIPGCVLVDGFVGATWKIARLPGQATLTVSPFARLSPAARAAIADEGAQLLEFAAAGQRHQLRFDRPR
jgi:winged helix DNA-binding protein